PRKSGVTEDMELDSHLMQKAAERYFLPKKVARLEADIKSLRQNKPLPKGCELKRVIAKIKRTHPASASEHHKIARLVDAYYEKNKKEVLDDAPRGWKRRPDFPRLLREALNHKEFKALVKTFISKAR